MIFDYRLCGLRVASAIALPDLPAWQGAARAADIEIASGNVPARLPDASHVSPFLQIAGQMRARVEVKAVAAYLVEDGRRITVAPAPGGEADAVALFLLRAACGIMWLQRGLFAMRASMVEIDGRAIALAGPSGIGKSTLAAALIDAGHRLLADDLSVIDAQAPCPIALPTAPVQRLWRDSLAALAIAPGARVRADPAMDKFERRIDHGFQPSPRPIGAVCHLDLQHLADRPAIARLGGGAAVQAVRGQAYRLHAAQRMGLEAPLFLQAGRIAAAVPQFLLRRPPGFADLRAFARALPDMLRAAAPERPA